ncbi:MAG: hypothetical protein ACRBN8_33765 [Nannocystales bacterium]
MRASALYPLGACFGLIAATALAACVDAPITADQLQADGTLRGGYAGSGVQQASLSAEPQKVAQAVRVSAVLASQAEGPLEDRAEFSAGVGTVYLHVRADGLLSSRRVVYRWRHDDFVVEVPGTLLSTDALMLGTSFDIAPEQSGHWEVDVLTDVAGATDAAGGQAPGTEPQVLFHREFVVEATAL